MAWLRNAVWEPVLFKREGEMHVVTSLFFCYCEPAHTFANPYLIRRQLSGSISIFRSHDRLTPLSVGCHISLCRSSKWCSGHRVRIGCGWSRQRVHSAYPRPCYRLAPSGWRCPRSCECEGWRVWYRASWAGCACHPVQSGAKVKGKGNRNVTQCPANSKRVRPH